MLPQSNGKIFLTEERGLTEKEWFRTYSTFNFGRFNNRNKSSFGTLAVLNEDTLAGGKTMYMPVTQATDIIIIPTVGDVEFADANGIVSVIQVGQVQLFSMQTGTCFTLTNPYETELVNFLQLWLQPLSPLSNQAPQLFAFDIENGKNSVISIFHHIQQITAASSTQYILSIGKFDGRKEAVYTLNNPKNGLFIFVIEGAFEVEYRLLHNGDGLALWNIDEVELEALSNNAVLLMLEAPL